MKKNLLKSLALCLPFLAASCSEASIEYTDFALPTVTIEELETTEEGTINVKFTPNEATASYDYAISLGDDYDAFVNQDLMTQEFVSSPKVDEVLFEDLQAGSSYTIYTLAYNEKGEKGSVHTISIKANDGVFLTSGLNYLMPDVAAFDIDFSTHYYVVNSYFGLASDREEDLKKLLEQDLAGMKTIKYNIKGYTYTFEDLTPETDYIFYTVGYDRLNRPTEVLEVPVTTPAAGSMPDVTVEAVQNDDIYYSKFKLTANEHCANFAFIHENAGESFYDSLIAGVANFAGNSKEMLKTWVEINSTDIVMSHKGEGLCEYYDMNMEPGGTYQFYVLLYDVDGRATGVRKLTLPMYNGGTTVVPDMPTITNATANKEEICYTVTAPENATFFYYEAYTEYYWNYGTGDSYISQMLVGMGNFVYIPTSETRTFSIVDNNNTLGHTPGKYVIAAGAFNADGELSNYATEVLTIEE